MADSATAAGLSIPLSLSTGPAISGGNPSAGGSGTGAFTVYSGQKSTAQRLTSVLPLIVLGVVVWAIKRKSR